MQITEQSKPWYQYRLVWMMIAIPFSAVIMGVVMIWLAIDTDDGLVVDDYYKHGLEINRDISRDKNAAALSLSATIEFNTENYSTDYSTGTQIFNVQFNKGLLETYPATLELNLQHATREDSDVAVSLDHGIDNKYIGYAKTPISKGVWYFEIKDKDWLLRARSHVQANNNIDLQSYYSDSE